jgi:hypothetical protein
MCYNFLLLFPSGFKEFLVAYTLVFFFSHFYPTGIFGGTIPFIDLKDELDQGGVLRNISLDDLIRFLVFPFGPISTTSMTPYVGKTSP